MDARRVAFERTYGVSSRWMEGLNVTGLALLIGYGILLWIPATNWVTHGLVTDEWGPVELGTFVAFLAAAAWSARLAWDARAHRAPRPIALVYAAFAVVCWLGAMEEISWGQSLFLSIQTPAWLSHINEQGETNLHDIVGLMELNSAFVLVFGLIGIATTRLRGRARPFAVPAVMLPLFVMIAAMAAVETVNDFANLGGRWAPLIGALSEVVELLGAVGCFAYAWLNGRRLRREWAGVAGGEATSATEDVALRSAT